MGRGDSNQGRGLSRAQRRPRQPTAENSRTITFEQLLGKEPTVSLKDVAKGQLGLEMTVSAARRPIEQYNQHDREALRAMIKASSAKSTPLILRTDISAGELGPRTLNHGPLTMGQRLIERLSRDRFRYSVAAPELGGQLDRALSAPGWPVRPEKVNPRSLRWQYDRKGKVLWGAMAGEPVWYWHPPSGTVAIGDPLRIEEMIWQQLLSRDRLLSRLMQPGQPGSGLMALDTAGSGSALGLEPHEFHQILSQGTFSSKLLEMLVAKQSGSKMMGNNEDFDILAPNGSLWELRTLTKHGTYFCPNSMVGSGRSFNEQGFLAKLNTVDGFLVADITGLPLVQMWSVPAEEIRQLHNKGRLGARASLGLQSALAFLETVAGDPLDAEPLFDPPKPYRKSRQRSQAQKTKAKRLKQDAAPKRSQPPRRRSAASKTAATKPSVG